MKNLSPRREINFNLWIWLLRCYVFLLFFFLRFIIYLAMKVRNQRELNKKYRIIWTLYVQIQTYVENFMDIESYQHRTAERGEEIS